MDYNVIDKYVIFIKKELLEFFRIVFKNNYKKSICMEFIEKYIAVRYHDETNYNSEKDFVKRLNKELVDVFNNNKENGNIDYMKTVVALFGYIIYIDGVCYVEKDLEILKVLVNNDVLKITDKDETLKILRGWYTSFKTRRDKFTDMIVSKDFNVLEDKIGRKLYYLDLTHSIKISNLYSEYAIDKAFNSGTVGEDKLFVLYIMSSSIVLNNAINLDFSRKYMVSIASTLFDKEKKLARLLNIISNPLAKKMISIKIKYSEYKENSKIIEKLTNEGYLFGLELDEKYEGNFNELLIFQYLLAKKDSDEYEFLINNKDKLMARIIKL